MKELFSKHSNLIKFALLSLVILLMLIMVVIRTEKRVETTSPEDAQIAMPDEQSVGESSGELQDYKDDESLSEDIVSDEKLNGAFTLTPTPEPEIIMEAFELLETDFAQLEETLGTGIPEGKPNERYFMAAGASIRYDHDSELVNKITIDGDGDNRAVISLLGIKIGDDFDKSQDILTGQGINIINLQENTYMCEFYLGNDKKRIYQIFMSGEDGNVSEMIISIK